MFLILVWVSQGNRWGLRWSSPKTTHDLLEVGVLSSCGKRACDGLALTLKARTSAEEQMLVGLRRSSIEVVILRRGEVGFECQHLSVELPEASENFRVCTDTKSRQGVCNVAAIC